MNEQHFILIVLWIAFCASHSFLADERIKLFFKKFLKDKFIFYRLMYSGFAFISLGLLLWYQFSIKSIYLFRIPILQYGAGVVFGLPGIYMMAVCINKYFYELSGIQALDKKKMHVTLQQTGLHAWVRHPLYSATLLFVWGLFFLFPSLANLIACVAIHIYVLLGIKLEEKKLYAEYGEAYRQYAKRVPKLVPLGKAYKK